MQELIFLVVLSTLLSSCSYFHVHKVEVEQGNYLTSNMVNRLHPGMSIEQVKVIMGEPVLVNIMNPHIESYVYTYQVGTSFAEKKVKLSFDHGVLRTIQREGV